MNILLITITPGDLQHDIVALVPSEKLEGIDLDAINHKILNMEEQDLSLEIEEWIINLYKRLGLEPLDPSLGDTPISMDLAQYIQPTFPCQIDKVVVFGWAV